MNDAELLRYSRHLLLPEVDAAGQERWLSARVLIIGMGGLGAPLSMYLAAAGVGRLVLADPDTVDLSNLQRQIVHDTHTIGQAKVESAAARLRALNPTVQLEPLARRLDPAELAEQVRLADVVADCSDNFATRFAVNAACVAQRTPLVSGAAVRWEGQLSVFLPTREDSPCYRCLYSDEGEELDQRCVDNGVLAPLVGVVGSLQAVEVLKVLLGTEETLCGRLLLFDARRMEWQTLKLRRDPACPVCGPVA